MDSKKVLQEMEKLRRELYAVANKNQFALNSQEVCEVSTRLDKLIIKYMYTGECRKTTYRQTP